MTRHHLCFWTTAVLALLSPACTKQSTSVDRAKLTTFAALPAAPASDTPAAAAKVALGRMLYFDARLSKGQDISCNSCHPLARYGADGNATSTGHAGKHGARNSPTVYNAALQFAQFWDGRAPDVEAQAGGPMLNPVEMAMPSEAAVVAVLKSMPGYVAAFRRAYPREKDPVTLQHATEAIGAFERGLLTPSRWDKFLAGDDTALTAEEKAGLNQFLATGCASCHSGALVGGGGFQKLGLVKPFTDPADPGRYAVTRNENDRMYFKVPTLRNVSATGPYFHDGKVTTLEGALAMMAEYQTGKKLSAAEIDSIAVWLKSLTGDVAADYVKEPELPRSTSRTPKPVREG